MEEVDILQEPVLPILAVQQHEWRQPAIRVYLSSLRNCPGNILPQLCWALQFYFLYFKHTMRQASGTTTKEEGDTRCVGTYTGPLPMIVFYLSDVPPLHATSCWGRRHRQDMSPLHVLQRGLPHRLHPNRLRKLWRKDNGTLNQRRQGNTQLVSRWKTRLMKWASGIRLDRRVGFIIPRIVLFDI